MIKNPEDLISLLKGTGYIASESISTILYLALTLEKPLLIEGPAGVGKTELAKSLARGLDLELLRLQCYEGLDESKALYEWEYSKQLLYIQVLKNKIGSEFENAKNLEHAVDLLSERESAFFSERFLLERPLFKSIRMDKRCVLLIDEIDKSDAEFEAFLLEFLADFSVTIPEIKTFHAKTPPIVILTSNDQRDLSDALKRRCVHLFIDYPEVEVEKAILSSRAPDADERLLDNALGFIRKIRNLELRKSPGISESVDWIRALLALGVREWKNEEIARTLSVLLKYKRDVEFAEKSLL